MLARPHWRERAVHDQKDLEGRLIQLEERLAALERWKADFAAESEQSAPVTRREREEAGIGPVVEAETADERMEPPVVQPPMVDFDLGLVGRTLIVLGVAFLLRAVTESGALPATVGVAIGLVYAVSWLVIALRPAVSRTSAAYHGVAAILAAYPLIFEAVRRFDVLGAWSSAFTLATVSVIWVLLAWRKMLNGVAWVATLGAMALALLLMGETGSMVPFVWYLTGLGVTTLWMGYRLKWHLLRWPTAALLDGVLLLMTFLVVSGRTDVEPLVAMAAGTAAFAAYLVSFVVRNLIRERNIVIFEILQTIVVLVCALGGAMWIAVSKETLQIPLALAVLALAAASYGVSFVFIPRHFKSPGNFFFYSSLALVLVLGAGSFVAEGLPSSVLWSAFALTSAYLAGRYDKPVLALHCAIYLVAGLIGADGVQTGFRMLVVKVDGGWAVAGTGAMLILFASMIAAGIHPIDRKGSYTIWTIAKLAILAVLGWNLATVIMSVIGSAFLGSAPDAAVVSVVRTAVLSGLTILTAWLARFPALSPARHLANILLVVLAMKLIWDDLRVGNPLSMFLSFACVGVAMILATRFRRKAVLPGVTSM